MKWGSLCSGIEGAAVAFDGFGWSHEFCAEIAKFPCELLAHHYPEVPNLGDITKTEDWPAVDLIVAGTPCQSFSVAGNRAGLDSVNGQLALRFAEIVSRVRPRWIVWENVAGVLSSNGGRDFRQFVGSLDELGYGLAWRVLDAQNFRIAQRRRRVFVVGSLGNWQRSFGALFDAPTRRIDASPPEPPRQGRRRVGEPDSSLAVMRPRPFLATGGIAPTLARLDGKNDQAFAVVHAGQIHPKAESPAPPITRQDGNRDSSYVVGWTGDATPKHGVDVSPTLRAFQGGEGAGVITPTEFRKLTITEWERLFGYPDDYTAVPGASERQRRIALGNTFCPPVVRWIGRRILEIEANTPEFMK